MIHTCYIDRLSEPHITKHQKSAWQQPVKPPGRHANEGQLNSTWHFKCGCTPSRGDFAAHLAAAAVRSQRYFLTTWQMLAGQRTLAPTHSVHCLIKDRWQLPSACLLSKLPHLPRSVQVDQSNCGAFFHFGEPRSIFRTHWRILCGCYLWVRQKKNLHYSLSLVLVMPNNHQSYLHRCDINQVKSQNNQLTCICGCQ